MKLGENILKLRKDNKLSQEQLAEKLNVTRQTISNWELGETQPTPEQLKILSKIFNVSIDKMLDNDIECVLDKISNTEKLAGIIIKILKFIGIALLAIFVIDIISFIVFASLKKMAYSENIDEVTMNCSINNNNYLITVGSDAYFNCNNCTKDMQIDINELIDYSDVDQTIEDIKNYFSDNEGSCK